MPVWEILNSRETLYVSGCFYLLTSFIIFCAFYIADNKADKDIENEVESGSWIPLMLLCNPILFL